MKEENKDEEREKGETGEKGGEKGGGEGGSSGGAGGGRGGGRRRGGVDGFGGRSANSGSERRKSAASRGRPHKSSTSSVVGFAGHRNKCRTTWVDK